MRLVLSCTICEQLVDVELLLSSQFLERLCLPVRALIEGNCERPFVGYEVSFLAFTYITVGLLRSKVLRQASNWLK